MKFNTLAACVPGLFVALGPSLAVADSAFTYQGELSENGEPATGTFDIEFSLWDALADGNQICCPVAVNNVEVVEGRFTAQLDFGAEAFNNDGRWLELIVNGFTLAPRQPVTRSPYAIQTRGIFVDQNNNVGIGTSTPNAKLDVEGGLEVTGDAASPAIRAVVTDPTAYAGYFTGGRSHFGGKVTAGLEGDFDAQLFVNAASAPEAIHAFNGNGRTAVYARTIGHDPGGAAVIHAELSGTNDAGLRVANGPDRLDVGINSINTHGDSPVADPLYLNNDVSNTVLIGFGGGNVGIGGGSAGLPLTKLHIDGGSDASATEQIGGFLLLGSIVGTNVVMDNNEIMARNNGAVSELRLNAEGGDVILGGGLQVAEINSGGGDVVFGGDIDIGYEVVESAECVDAGNGTRASVSCPNGKQVIGGGCWSGSAADDLTESRPMGTTGWSCHKDADCDPPIRAYAICARVK